MSAIRYEKSTETMRSVPENYCLAYRENNKWKAYQYEGATRTIRPLIKVICFFANLLA